MIPLNPNIKLINNIFQAAETEMKRKAAESDYEDFLGISTGPKRIKTLPSKGAASKVDLKSLNSFIASKEAALKVVTSGIQGEKQPKKDSAVAGSSGVQNKKSVAHKSGIQKSDNGVCTPKSSSGTPRTPGSLNNTKAHTPTSRNNCEAGTRTSGSGTDNQNPLARTPFSSTSRVTPTQQQTPSSSSTNSQDKTSKK